MSNIRSRKFFIRVSQINNTKDDGIVRYDFQEIYQALCSRYQKVMYIVHDKDSQNIHAHFIVQHKTQIRKETLIGLIKYCDIEKQRGSNLQCYEYLQHKNVENKDAYEETDIICNFSDELEHWLQMPNETRESNYQQMIRDLYDGATPHEIMKNYPNEYFNHQKKIISVYHDLLEQRSSEIFRDIQSFYVWGDSRTGKTRSVTQYCKTNQFSYHRVTEYEKDPFQGYTDEKVLILDEFRSNFSVSSFLTYLDGYEKTYLPSRYTNKYALYDIVFIISNIPLYQQYIGADEKTRVAIKNRIKYEINFMENEIVILERGIVIYRMPNPYYSNKERKKENNDKQ